MEHTYPAAQQAEAHGQSYADYIQKSTAEHVAKGHYTEEFAMSRSLGDALAGNNGD